MPQIRDAIRKLLERWDLNSLPTIEQIFNSMDPVAWTLLALLASAVLLGLFFILSTRRTFEPIDETEATPTALLERLERDPTLLPPHLIVSRLGSEATLQFLIYGDQMEDEMWRYKWGSVREEILRLMSKQNAFGPTYALARYYESEDKQEPDTIRIRRTVLIHKLGQERSIGRRAGDSVAQLRIRCHPAEVAGDLGFNGATQWLLPDEPVERPLGPLVEMEPIEFRTLQDAEVLLHIRRTPMSGGGFRLRVNKRRNFWVIVEEQMEWVG